MAKTPTYIVKNSLGIYNFQYRFTAKVRRSCPGIAPLFRRSLYTRCRKTAIKHSKYWSMIMDELTSKLLNAPYLLGKAITLLKKYQNIEGTDWQKAEQFLMNLDENESAILDRAIEQHNRVLSSYPLKL